MNFYSLKVIDIRIETKDCITIFFKQPGLKRIKYHAGQYLSVIFRIKGRRYIRPYSFSSAPGVNDTLNITVKKVPGGVVSNHIADTLKAGDIVEVMEPMGNFILPVDYGNKHIYLWGAGSGITPLISIAKHVLSNDKNNAVILAYGNRQFEGIILKNEIEELELKFGSVFSAHYFLTKPFIDKLNPNVVAGRISSEHVKNILDKKKINILDTIHYICGPVGLKESVKNALFDLGISSSSIFSEDFEITRDPKDFEGIKTQNVVINKGGNFKIVEVGAGKSILEAGLDSFIDLSYSCQTGNCMVCRGRIVKGQVKMIGVETAALDLQTNECLLCCSFPVSDNLEIEVD